MLVWTAPVVLDKPRSVIDGGGGVNLYFYRLGTATSMLSMEDVETDGREVNKKGGCLKILFISILKIELWHLCKSLLPLCEGTFYLLLCCVITFYKQAPETE